MAKMNYTNGRVDVDDYIFQAAEEMADAMMANYKKMSGNFDKVSEEDLLNAYYADSKKKLMKALEGKEIDDERTIRALEGMTGDESNKWLNMGGQDPFTLAKVKEFKDWSNVLKVDDNGKRAYLNMNPEQIKADALSKGYRWYDEDERKEYFKKREELENELSKGEIQKEFLDSGLGKLNQILFPSATKEALLQANGKDYDEGNVIKGAVVDGVANVAMAEMPGIKFVRNPIVNGAIGAGLQGVEEAGRSVMGSLVTGEDVDVGDAVKSGSESAVIGLTVPGMVGTGAGILGSIPGANSFARGMSRSVKAMDPVYNESLKVRDAVKNAIKTKGKDAPLNPKEMAVMGSAKNGDEYMKILGVNNAKDAVEAYEKTAAGKGVLNPEGVTINTATPEQMENFTKAQQVFHAANENLAGLNKSEKAGRALGTVVQGVGSRVEPIVQGNPLKEGKLRSVGEDYKNEDWYKKLTPAQKAAFDAAWNKKQD